MITSSFGALIITKKNKIVFVKEIHKFVLLGSKVWPTCPDLLVKCRYISSLCFLVQAVSTDLNVPRLDWIDLFTKGTVSRILTGLFEAK